MSMTFGERLAGFRKKCNMTQEDVGDKLGVSAQAVSKWENDTTLPDPITLKKLADLYNVTLNDVYGVEHDTPRIILGEKKDINQMLLRIVVDTVKGDKVRVNVPLALVKILMDSGAKMPEINGNDFLKNIDFKQILELVSNGVIGNLVEVTTAEGDVVHIVVE
jgi:transcriptional regulator with XRE-family HTH domain